jgi:hypothetical protein
METDVTGLVSLNGGILGQSNPAVLSSTIRKPGKSVDFDRHLFHLPVAAAPAGPLALAAIAIP